MLLSPSLDLLRLLCLRYFYFYVLSATVSLRSCAAVSKLAAAVAMLDLPYLFIFVVVRVSFGSSWCLRVFVVRAVRSLRPVMTVALLCCVLGLD